MLFLEINGSSSICYLKYANIQLDKKYHKKLYRR